MAEGKTKELTAALAEIKTEDHARLIGLVSHFAYWCIFGHAHSIPLDSTQRGQVFLSIVHLFNEIKNRVSK